jgi:hypothetical protein
MSHPEHLRAHAQYMRTRAEILQQGDEEARRHASDLELEAQEIDRQLLKRESAK